MFSKIFRIKQCVALTIVLFPAVVAQAQQTNVFARGTDGALLHFDGSRWESRGGQIVGSPDACSWGPDRIDVVARGTDNSLRQIARVGGRWTQWYNLGGNLTSSPTCVSWGPNRIDVFAVGADRSMLRKAWDGAQWRDWQSIGGQFPPDASPDAVSRGANHIIVVARGMDGAVWKSEYLGNENSGWEQWSSLGGRLASEPGAVAWRGSRLDVFGQNADDHQMWQITLDGANRSPWVPRGGLFNAGDGPEVVSTSSNTLLLFARGKDGALWQSRRTADNVGGWERVGGQITSDAGAVFIHGGGVGPPQPAPTPSPSMPSPSPAPSGRFRVSLTGFRVNRETWDDILERDGKRDEVFLDSRAAIITRDGSFSPQRNLVGAVVIGDTNGPGVGRRRGGNASTAGGLMTGNAHPSARMLESIPTNFRSGGEPPFVAFEGEIVQGQTAAIIVPTIWEWDAPMHVYNRYDAIINTVLEETVRHVRPIMAESPRSDVSLYVISAADLGGDFIGGHAAIAASSTGEVASRPIGMFRSGDQYHFVPKVLVLTYEAALLATRDAAPGSFGVIRIGYRDPEDLKGDYTIFLVVERLP